MLMVLVGRFKMPYQDFFLLSIGERKAIEEGHNIDIKERMEFERDMFGLTVTPYAKKGWNIRRSYFFPWETIPEPFKATKEDIAEAKRISELVKNLRHGKSKDRSRGRG